MNIFIVTGLWIIGDIVSGLAKALKNHELDSSKLRAGIYHKMSYVLCVCVAIGIDYTQSYIPLGYEIPIVEPVCILICLTEIISILENICELNPELQESKIYSLLKGNKE